MTIYNDHGAYDDPLSPAPSMTRRQRYAVLFACFIGALGPAVIGGMGYLESARMEATRNRFLAGDFITVEIKKNTMGDLCEFQMFIDGLQLVGKLSPAECDKAYGRVPQKPNTSAKRNKIAGRIA